MMQVAPKWKITIYGSNVTETIIFYISNNFSSNVLRMVADIDFDVPASKITIEIYEK